MCIQYSRLRQPAPHSEQAIVALLGSVRTPRTLNLSELSELPQTSRRLTLICEALTVSPRRWDTRVWSGVPFAALLDAAGADSDAQSVEVAGYDGAISSFALADLGDALLAVEADGRPLSAKDGFPARLIIPGQTACAMPRFVQRIAFSHGPAAALALPAPQAVIDHVEPIDGGVRLSGRAFHADFVTVRLEDGPPVRVPVAYASIELAAEWTAEWPWVSAQNVRFSVSAHSTADESIDRPLARRWKPAHHRWAAPRSVEQ